jgi:CheY-like chemotaxis protein
LNVVEEENDVFAGGPGRILVIEDDAMLREIAVRTLAMQGYEVVEAGNGPEAIELLSHSEHIDLLFTDIALPGGMNGVEIAEAAATIQPDIKVLFTTGYSEKSVTYDGQSVADEDLVNKPYRRKELLEKVRSILNTDP